MLSTHHPPPASMCWLAECGRARERAVLPSFLVQEFGRMRRSMMMRSRSFRRLLAIALGAALAGVAVPIAPAGSAQARPIVGRVSAAVAPGLATGGKHTE